MLAWIAAKALIVNAGGIEKADAILVLSNTAFLEERSRRAAELLLAGRAPRIVLTNENQISRWSESQQRNLYTHEWEKEELRRAGISDDKIDVITEPVTGTYSEAVRALDYAQKHELKSLLVVTSAYHSRRALWTFRQVFSDSGIAVDVEPVAPWTTNAAADFVVVQTFGLEDSSHGISQARLLLGSLSFGSDRSNRKAAAVCWT